MIFHPGIVPSDEQTSARNARVRRGDPSTLVRACAEHVAETARRRRTSPLVRNTRRIFEICRRETEVDRLATAVNVSTTSERVAVSDTHFRSTDTIQNSDAFRDSAAILSLISG